MRALLLRCLRHLRAFAAQPAGVAAVEFALVLPAALFLYLGACEISNAIVTSRHLSEVTRSSVDLLSQQPTFSNSTSTPAPTGATTGDNASSLIQGVQILMQPKPTDPLAITLSAVDVTNNASGMCCSVLVRWSVTQGGTLRPCNVQLTRTADGTIDPASIPTDLLPTAGLPLVQPIYYLVADTSYAYRPLIGGAFVPKVKTMHRTEYMRPRSTGQVILASVPTSNGETGHICF